MPAAIFDDLDTEWSRLCTSSAASTALANWKPEPALAAESLDDLVERIWAAPTIEADQRLAALARLAADDVLAARTLLQALRPGLRTLAVRLGHGQAREEIFREVVTIAWELIRTYPAQRRPERIAANILLDTRKAIWRERRAADRDTATLTPLDEVPAGACPVTRSAEHDALDGDLPSLHRAHQRLQLAVDAGVVTPDAAAIIWRTRILEATDDVVAGDLGVKVRTMQRRRQRAERKVGAAC